MRRLFQAVTRKDKNREDKENSSGGAAQKGKTDALAKPQPEQRTLPPAPAQDGSATAANGDGHHLASKQVAFATEVSRLSAPLLSPESEVRSLISHHGALGTSGSGLACFPVRPSPAVPPSSTPVPSNPIRHPQLDRHDANATVRPGLTSPQRGDIPRFNGQADDAHTDALAMFQQRSTTSMSHATTASNASSSYAASSNQHGGLYGATQTYYPNLAVLATYARDASIMTGGNGIAQHLTWSEITDDDLVENLGSRERTRQEVLFEMVCSEERFVQELIALRENYLDPILARCSGGLAASQTVRSISTLPDPVETIRSTDSFDARRPHLDVSTSSRFAKSGTPVPTTPTKHPRSPVQPENASVDHLPIAARFARRASVDSTAGNVTYSSVGHSRYDGSPNMSSDSGEVFARGRRDISGGTTTSGGTATTAMTSVDGGETSDAANTNDRSNSTNSKSRFAARLQPLFTNANVSKTHTIGSSAGAPNTSSSHVGTINIPKAFRHHLKNLAPPPPNKLHKASNANLQLEKELPLVVPEDLRLVCQTIVEHLLEGHDSLSTRLRARYEEQFPLVRTLADVFTDQAWMVRHYAVYVLHLEKALEDVQDALQLANPTFAQQAKKLKDKESLKEQKRLAKLIMALEEEAAIRGAPGLAICLSQPFQRLLKYPLLFQSLLYHSDPSLRDYDATQKLAFKIDAIVRSIEDEKILDDQRTRTRDCWARIEGINDRTLMMPRAERLLVSEVAMWSTTSAGIAAARRTFSDASRDLKSIEEVQAESKKEKHASRRLSDFVPGQAEKQKQKKQPSVGSKRDVWLVTFSDVVIRCQRVGVTKLPMGLQHYSTKDSGKKYVSLARQERNLYKFLKIDHWIMAEQTRRSGVVSMEAVAKSRLSSKPEENEETSSESELDHFVRQERSRKPTAQSGGDSRMSFTYASEDPRPAFDVDPLIGLVQQAVAPPSPARKAAQAAKRNFSPTTQDVVNKQGLANAKHANRVRQAGAQTGLGASPASSRIAANRAVTPNNARAAEKGGNFNRPTAAYLAKQTAMQQSRPGLPGNGLPSPGRKATTSPIPVPEPKRVRAASSSASSPRTSPKQAPVPVPHSPRVRRNSFSAALPEAGKNTRLRTKHSSEKLVHPRKGSDMDSGVALFNNH